MHVPVRDLIDFSIMSMLGAITAGPGHLKNVVEQCAVFQETPVKGRRARSSHFDLSALWHWRSFLSTQTDV
jgi:hypothetical protein